ncbi:MAG: Bifunctional phosphoglucose/phosphomannose isomerase [Parcubacteria group bacterium GW2011_GWB1_38_8]|uniref:SIS domain-containing protein n=1 Tax=Candidatus Zambryskibacteria bacterium RIFCSPLOWO2_02_FULL_39_14 TaxID=1802769 RepID=A0A1G2UG90_9BACT|nr:MAG: Bifunctional phosphoglucose/phosphomannose isomerase [Parcubacteria group bacterium GW2011_GWB1_38_8]OHA94865.1 MAG: hypothetical protein A3C62_01540 [Candidatus Zambryskibacteria bacterium RIFCSPHIGHO2_02_FULL_39_16]OHB08415.1 MAG: hypothetical protein A3I86_00970 [Candidatus Zambryskibacteria bacterium RIFCSPLOWO2_02_FULL_39_14]
MKEKELKDQLSFSPVLEGGLLPEDFTQYDNVIIGGMGGSGMAARLLFFLDPLFPAWIHDDYGFPEKHEGKTLYVAISYSGNTKETLSFVQEALDKKYPLAVIASGGKLLEIAKEHNIPYVLIPSGFQPRNAVIYTLKGLLRVLGKDDLIEKLEKSNVDFSKACELGQDLGKKFENKIPVIYSSRVNKNLSYLWKIILNETAKVPAFYNYFPELAHNEMQGIIPKTAGPLVERIKILILLDPEGDVKLEHHMEAFQKFMSTQGVDLESVNMPEDAVYKLIFTFVVAGAMAYTIAELHGTDPNDIQMIESFKKLL